MASTINRKYLECGKKRLLLLASELAEDPEKFDIKKPLFRTPMLFPEWIRRERRKGRLSEAQSEFFAIDKILLEFLFSPWETRLWANGQLTDKATGSELAKSIRSFVEWYDDKFLEAEQKRYLYGYIEDTRPKNGKVKGKRK